MKFFKLSKKGKPEEFIGEFEFTVGDVVERNEKEFSILNGRSEYGLLKIIKMNIWNQYAFMDYIHGGMSLSLFVAVDFTLGNKNWKDPHSLHYVDEMKEWSSSDEEMAAAGDGEHVDGGDTKAKTKK